MATKNTHITSVEANKQQDTKKPTTPYLNYYYGNLTHFLNKETIIVSDLEGVAPTSQINPIMKGDKQVLYLGDLCDYTYNLVNVDGKDKILRDPEIPEIPEIPVIPVKQENLCMLRLMKHFVDHQNSETGATRWILGNRELNKIKLKHLLRMNDNSTYWKNKATDKNSNALNVLQLAKNLVDQNNTLIEKRNSFQKTTLEYEESILWAVDGNDFKDFSPYWNNSNTAYKPRWLDSDIETKTLKQRFDIIFGLDPSVGTMSAQNTLYELPREYGIDDDMITDIEADELRSALVFIIYMRLLDDSLYKDKNAGEYDGYLYQYLVYGSCVNYAYKSTTTGNDLYLFSHAGMKLNFFIDDNTILDYLSNITDTQWKTEIIGQTKQSGGNLYDNDVKKIEKFNTQVINLIKIILDYDYIGYEFSKYAKDHKLKHASILHQIPELHKGYTNAKNLEHRGKAFTNLSENASILYLYIQMLGAVAVPAYSNTNLNDLILKEANFGFKENFMGLSPVSITPADTLTNEDLSSLNANGNVINVFGHTTFGFGYTFNKVGKKSFLITTDFSNGFMKTSLLDGKQYNYNYLLLLFKFNSDKIFYLDGNIYYDTNNFKEYTEGEIKGNVYKNNAVYNMSNLFVYNYEFNLDDFPNPSDKYERYNGEICKDEYRFNFNSKCNNGIKLYTKTNGVSKLLYLDPASSTPSSGGSRKSRKVRKVVKRSRVRRSRQSHRIRNL